MSWNPAAHSNQDNLTWSLVRAMEWGRWPIFLSQPLAPILLVFFDWKYVIAGTIALNLLWATLVRYQWVSVSLASMGAIAVKLKWLVCPTAAVYLFLQGKVVPAGLCLFWPFLIFIIGAVPTTQIGKIQNMFMAELGYEPLSLDLRALSSLLNELTFNSDVSDRLIKKARGKYREKTEAEIYELVIEEYRKDHSASTYTSSCH